jgi:futalosine hydrolase
MICLLAATPHETSLLRRQLPFSPGTLLVGRSFSCHLFGTDILLLHTGIGAVSATLNLTRMLERTAPQLLICFGCGGSFPAAGLKVGDLAVATSEFFGDLGAASDQGFVPLAAMGLVEKPGDPGLFRQQLSLDEGWSKAALSCLRAARELRSQKISAGPFVTVNTVSGTAALCHELEARSGGLCESMEGAAFAQVAAEYGVPLIEVRGISNPCGTREPRLWDLPAGMTIAQRAVLRLLRDLPELRSSLCC